MAPAEADTDHFVGFGGVPLVSVYDRPKTVALHRAKDGAVTEWNSTFAAVTLDLGVGVGVGVEVCWPARGNEKGSVENLVGWVTCCEDAHAATTAALVAFIDLTEP